MKDAAANTGNTTQAGGAAAVGDQGGAGGGDVDVSEGELNTTVQALGNENGKDQKDAAGKDGGKKDAKADGKGLSADEQKAADEKAKADAAAKDAKVEVKFGDLKVDAKLADQFSGVAKELGLKSEQAQKLADVYVAARKAEDTALQNAIQQQNKQWLESMRSDKEIGGAAFSKSIVNARKAMTKFAPELEKDLAAYGLLNLPSMVKAFARIGGADAEDSLGEGAHGAGGKGAPSRKEELERRYPTMAGR